MTIRPAVVLALLASSFLAVAQSPVPQKEWWRNAVVYEIYPRSFQDSNGDGIGDLNGITARLDYLKKLGIDAIWLSPMFPSPQADFGYDVSDYNGIDPKYGTMADFDRLMAESKKRGIRILLDGVYNHSSDQHPWFIESRSSKTNPKRDWYVWHDGKADGGPPNNWFSGFSHGSAWTLDPKTNQFYYHNFLPQQPDLNWRNPAVRKAVYDSMSFWYSKGVAGFRLDAMLTYLEDEQLRDNPNKGKGSTGDGSARNPFTNSLPEDNEIFKEMRAVTDKFPGRVLIGEDYTQDIAQLATYYGPHNDEIQLPMDMQVGFIDKLDATAFRTAINNAETRLNGNTPFITFDNHDKPRSWDRYGDGVHNADIARLIATLLLTTRSAAQMYYGQELGMVTTPPVSAEASQDPIARTNWPKTKGRDGERTPMQWDATKDAGFSSADKTWLPVPPSYAQINAQAEEKDPNSLLIWYTKLIALRHHNPAFADGDFQMLLPTDANVLAFVRQFGKTKVVVTCNFSAQPQTVDLGVDAEHITTLAANSADMKTPTTTHAVTLPPFASWIAEVQ